MYISQKNYAEKVSRCQLNYIQLTRLPIMQTDLVLQKGNKTLIVDAKFYSENMVARFAGGATL